MANNLGVNEYTVGGDYDTWGDKYVEDMSILNKLAGDTLTVTDTSGTVTLNVEDCQNFAIRANGGTSSQVDIRVPDSISRFWYVRNDRSTGAITVRCVTGGTSVSIPAGERRMVQSDGTNCVDLTLTTIAIASVNGLQTALDAKQPLDSDLTAIAALTTTTFGRSLLTLADAAAGLTALGAQPADSDLTAIAALSTTSYGRAFLALADAAAGRTALGLGTSAVQDVATAAHFRANTADKALDTDGVWSAAAEVTLSDAATIAFDQSSGINFKVTLGGNRAMGQPSNTINGKTGRIIVKQDATGSRTMSWHADFEFAGGSAPTLSTTAGAEDVFYYDQLAANRTLITTPHRQVS